jgi:hypothetical protein
MIFLLWDRPASSLGHQLSTVEPCPQFVVFQFLALPLHVVGMNRDEVAESFAEREHV